jgi:hypothetical protein
MVGKNIAGINVNWDFPSKRVGINMQSCIKNLLLSLSWPMPKKPQLSPLTTTTILYGQKTQFAPDKDTSAPLLPKCRKCIQKIISCSHIMQKLSITSFWLNSMPSAHNELRQRLALLVETLLNYITTYPNNGIIYRACGMVLCAHADAGYLNETKSHSRAGAHIYLSKDNPIPCFNSTVLTIATIIMFVMALAVLAELAVLVIAAREMVPHQQTLIVMRWPQPCSPIQMDNSTAVRITNKTIYPKRATMIDMRLWWLQCCGSQKQFCYYWDTDSKIRADYSTKHHPDKYHGAYCPTHAGIWNI